METLSYEIEINAPKDKIWDVLWNPATYSKWTQFFSPDSIMKTDWEIHGKTYFLDNKTGNGMVSTIESLDEPNEIVFKHLGMIENGVEDTQSKEVMEWSGAYEKYFLISLDNGKVKLQTETQVDNQWKEHIDHGFIKGLEIIKQLSEA